VTFLNSNDTGSWQTETM